MGPLSGFRVLDFSAIVSGPLAGAVLADQGAEVIKIEPPQGEQMRRAGSVQNEIPATFYSCNRGKKSLCLDLKSEDAVAIVLELFASADIVIQNFRPGVAERMGIGFEAAKKQNPSVVYVSISGFGTEGPYSRQRVYDPIIQALSGATDIQADRITGKPTMIRTLIADKVTSLITAQAISAALVHRERTGEGQHIDISMLDAMLAFFWPGDMSAVTYAENETDPRATVWSRDLIFETKDGHITAGAVSRSEWQGLCDALDLRQLMDDPEFSILAASREQTERRLDAMASAIAKFTTAEVMERLQDNQVPSAPILSRSELIDHEQIKCNQSIKRFNVEGFGEVRQAEPAARFEKTPQSFSTPAPKLGEHSVEILGELGRTREQIDSLLDSGGVISNPGN